MFYWQSVMGYCRVLSTVFGWQLGISDRDVLLHTLPQFHVNGWTIPYAATAMGVKQVILRKVDGAEIHWLPAIVLLRH